MKQLDEEVTVLTKIQHRLISAGSQAGFTGMRRRISQDAHQESLKGMPS